MDPVPVFDPDNGATWLQTSDAVTITVPLGEKPRVSIHPQRLEVEATGGESKILDHDLFAQVRLKRSGPGDLFLKHGLKGAARVQELTSFLSEIEKVVEAAPGVHIFHMGFNASE